MTNWRDGASEEVQDDFDRLAEVTIAAARNFLEFGGDFIPFPMVIKAVTEDMTEFSKEVADAKEFALAVFNLNAFLYVN